MVNNLSDGVVQVFSLDVASINYALRDLGERIDALRGLRGRGATYDRFRVDSPTVDTDAVDLQSLLTQESRFRLSFLTPPGIAIDPPGTTYAEISQALRQNIDWSDLTDAEARILVRGWGNETGNAKGIALHDGTNTICEVEWNGHTESLRTGAFTAVTLTADTQMQLRAKGSSATESLILVAVIVEVKSSIEVITA